MEFDLRNQSKPGNDPVLTRASAIGAELGLDERQQQRLSELALRCRDDLMDVAITGEDARHSLLASQRFDPEGDHRELMARERLTSAILEDFRRSLLE